MDQCSATSIPPNRVKTEQSTDPANLFSYPVTRYTLAIASADRYSVSILRMYLMTLSQNLQCYIQHSPPHLILCDMLRQHYDYMSETDAIASSCPVQWSGELPFRYRVLRNSYIRIPTAWVTHMIIGMQETHCQDNQCMLFHLCNLIGGFTRTARLSPTQNNRMYNEAVRLVQRDN